MGLLGRYLRGEQPFRRHVRRQAGLQWAAQPVFFIHIPRRGQSKNCGGGTKIKSRFLPAALIHPPHRRRGAGRAQRDGPSFAGHTPPITSPGDENFREQFRQGRALQLCREELAIQLRQIDFPREHPVRRQNALVAGPVEDVAQIKLRLRFDRAIGRQTPLEKLHGDRQSGLGRLDDVKQSGAGHGLFFFGRRALPQPVQPRLPLAGKFGCRRRQRNHIAVGGGRELKTQFPLLLYFQQNRINVLAILRHRTSTERVQKRLILV